MSQERRPPGRRRRET